MRARKRWGKRAHAGLATAEAEATEDGASRRPPTPSSSRCVHTRKCTSHSDSASARPSAEPARPFACYYYSSTRRAGTSSQPERARV